jgi:hypothetical protein
MKIKDDEIQVPGRITIPFNSPQGKKYVKLLKFVTNLSMLDCKLYNNQNTLYETIKEFKDLQSLKIEKCKLSEYECSESFKYLRKLKIEGNLITHM